MKKIYLASFLEKENFGTSRVISITSGSKPRDIEVESIFTQLTPPKALVAKYNLERLNDAISASNMFIDAYKKQLEDFFEEVDQMSKETGKPVTELLPLEDGDTLASWERANFTNYRKILAPYLEKIGYEVILN